MLSVIQNLIYKTKCYLYTPMQKLSLKLTVVVILTERSKLTAFHSSETSTTCQTKIKLLSKSFS